VEPEFSLGARLRNLRRERELSQRDLAERAGLSANTVSLIERDEISPSVATLQRLAAAFGVRMAYFFEGPAETKAVLARAGTRPSISGAGVTIEALGARLAEQHIDPFYLTLAPGGNAGSRQVVHTGQELVCCVRGRVQYEVDGTKYDLEPGDFLLFRAELPHYWTNPGRVPAELFLVLGAPEPDGRPVRGHFPGYDSVKDMG
jgi:transcriptional regulator with XRE-family HTH domain